MLPFQTLDILFLRKKRLFFFVCGVEEGKIKKLKYFLMIIWIAQGHKNVNVNLQACHPRCVVI
jgi:hypothetical protein